MTYFQIYPISFSSVRDPQGDTFHLRVDDTFLPQATVVDLSGEAKTRPWTDRYPLAGWGILQGLADWDLCILFTADIRSEESLTESNGDQHLDPCLTDDAPEREKMECFVFSFFIISCNVCLPIWTSWTDGKCRVKMLKWDTFKGWEHKSAVHTWCWLSDLGVGGLALVRLQTSAVPDSLQGAEAGPQGRPGPARRRCCKTHEGPKFTHRHSTAHLWSFSKISNPIFYAHFFSWHHPTGKWIHQQSDIHIDYLSPTEEQKVLSFSHSHTRKSFVLSFTPIQASNNTARSFRK